MKTKISISLLVLTVILLCASCEFDNYDEPNVMFTGRLVDGDQVLNTKRGIVFKLFQYREDGFISAGSTWISVYMDQEGNFSSLLFPGRYKMVVNTNNGDIEDADIYSDYTWKDFDPVSKETGLLDTIYVMLDKNRTMEFQVSPYYRFENAKAFFRNDSIITNFSIRKLVDDEASTLDLSMRNVSLFVSPTMHINWNTESFVNMSKKVIIAYKDLKTGEATDALELGYPLSKYYSNDSYVNNYRNYAYLRLGISTNAFGGVYNYSSILKVEGIPEDVIKKYK